MPIPPAFFNQSRARRPAKPGLRALLYPIRRSLSAPISSTYCFNILCCGYLVDHSLPSLSAPSLLISANDGLALAQWTPGTIAWLIPVGVALMAAAIIRLNRLT